jgi:hypothetical protein
MCVAEALASAGGRRMAGPRIAGRRIAGPRIAGRRMAGPEFRINPQ